MKKWTKLFALMLAVVLLCTALSACGQSGNTSQAPSSTPNSTPQSTPESKPESTPESTPEVSDTSEEGYAWQANTDPITITIYVDDPGTMWEKWGTDPVSQRVTEKTGISFKCIAPVSSDDTKLTLLVASDELPDYVTANYNASQWDSMYKQGQLADLEALSDQYAPKLKSELVDPEVWEHCRTEDGHVYTLLSCWNSTETFEWLKSHDHIVSSNQPVALIRQDYLEEVTNKNPTTPDEFHDMCMEIKEKHPDTIPFYTGGLTGSGPSYLLYMFGLGTYYVDENLNVSRSFHNPNYLGMLKWVNRMVNDGLMTEDSFVDTDNDKDAKSLAGKVATYVWTVGETYKVPADNPDTYYYPMGPWDGYEQVRTNNGYIRFGVSAKASDEAKDACMRFLEFGNSLEGFETLVCGIEGTKDDDYTGDLINGPHFYYEDDPTSPGGRKATWYESFYNAKLADWSGVEMKSGLGGYHSYVFTSGIYQTETETMKSDLSTEMNELYLDHVRYDDPLLFSFEAGSDALVANQTITSLIAEYWTQWAFAPNEEEVERLYNEFLQRAADSDEATLNQWLTEKYQSAGGSTPTPVK